MYFTVMLVLYFPTHTPVCSVSAHLWSRFFITFGHNTAPLLFWGKLILDAFCLLMCSLLLWANMEISLLYFAPGVSSMPSSSWLHLSNLAITLVAFPLWRPVVLPDTLLHGALHAQLHLPTVSLFSHSSSRGFCKRSVGLAFIICSVDSGGRSNWTL